MPHHATGARGTHGGHAGKVSVWLRREERENEVSQLSHPHRSEERRGKVVAELRLTSHEERDSSQAAAKSQRAIAPKELGGAGAGVPVISESAGKKSRKRSSIRCRMKNASPKKYGTLIDANRALPGTRSQRTNPPAKPNANRNMVSSPSRTYPRPSTAAVKNKAEMSGIPLGFMRRSRVPDPAYRCMFASGV